MVREARITFWSSPAKVSDMVAVCLSGVVVVLISLPERVSMFGMDSVELGDFSHRLQVACTQLTSGIPDTPVISVDEEGLRFSSPVWTAAMTRDVLSVKMQPSSLSAKMIAANTLELTMASAVRVVEKLLGPTLKVQIDRWALACEKGLFATARHRTFLTIAW